MPQSKFMLDHDGTRTYWHERPNWLATNVTTAKSAMLLLSISASRPIEHVAFSNRSQVLFVAQLSHAHSDPQGKHLEKHPHANQRTTARFWELHGSCSTLASSSHGAMMSVRGTPTLLAGKSSRLQNHTKNQPSATVNQTNLPERMYNTAGPWSRPCWFNNCIASHWSSVDAHLGVWQRELRRLKIEKVDGIHSPMVSILVCYVLLIVFVCIMYLYPYDFCFVTPEPSTLTWKCGVFPQQLFMQHYFEGKAMVFAASFRRLYIERFCDIDKLIRYATKHFH